MTKDLINRITYHLSSGGLFNPELADHLAVRNLLMECRDALAQPEQEPVVFNTLTSLKHKKTVGPIENAMMNITPPQRTWVGLTDEEAQQTFAKHNCTISTHLAGILTRAIEAKLKEKNT